MSIDVASLQRIVIIDPAFLGDTVFNGPLVRALKKRQADLRVDLVVRPPSQIIASQIRGVDKVYVFDKRQTDAGLRGLRRMAQVLKAEAYDLALIPHPSIRSTLLAYLAKIPHRIGTARGLAGLFLTEGIKTGVDESFTGQRLRLIGAEEDDSRVNATIDAEVESEKSGDKFRLGLLMGSAWATKCWSKAQARRLLQALDPSRFEVVFLGAEWEREKFDGLFDAEVNVLDRIGQPLKDMIAEIGLCDVVIGGDTGPLHIARGMSVPVVGLYGPSSEHRHEFSDHDIILSQDIECRPCSAHGHQRCPLEHHRCMVDLDANRVKDAILKVLG